MSAVSRATSVVGWEPGLRELNKGVFLQSPPVRKVNWLESQGGQEAWEVILGA